jgi:hypothetical protein
MEGLLEIFTVVWSRDWEMGSEGFISFGDFGWMVEEGFHFILVGMDEKFRKFFMIRFEVERLSI